MDVWSMTESPERCGPLPQKPSRLRSGIQSVGTDFELFRTTRSSSPHHTRGDAPIDCVDS